MPAFWRIKAGRAGWVWGEEWRWTNGSRVAAGQFSVGTALLMCSARMAIKKATSVTESSRLENSQSNASPVYRWKTNAVQSSPKGKKSELVVARNEASRVSSPSLLLGSKWH